MVILQNLDVNLAVNNLLSRDDDEGEEADEAGDPYMSGINPLHFYMYLMHAVSIIYNRLIPHILNTHV